MDSGPVPYGADTGMCRFVDSIVMLAYDRTMAGSDPPRECDVVVVGAGILGLATARELALRHDGMRVIVLEREGTIAEHQTGRTSGVIHAGIYYRPGSLKASLCVNGARALYEYCEERGIRTERAG